MLAGRSGMLIAVRISSSRRAVSKDPRKNPSASMVRWPLPLAALTWASIARARAGKSAAGSL